MYVKLLKGQLKTLGTQSGYPLVYLLGYSKKTNPSRLLVMLLKLSIIMPINNQSCQKPLRFRVKNIVKIGKSIKQSLREFFRTSFIHVEWILPLFQKKYWPFNIFQYLQDHFFILSMNIFTPKKIINTKINYNLNLKWWYTKTYFLLNFKLIDEKFYNPGF